MGQILGTEEISFSVEEDAKLVGHYGLIKPDGLKAKKAVNIHVVKGKCDKDKRMTLEDETICGRPLNKDKNKHLKWKCLSKDGIRKRMAMEQNQDNDVCGGCAARMYATEGD